MTYQLPSIGVSWAAVFHQMESNKERLGIVDYSVSQTTLDQVCTCTCMTMYIIIHKYTVEMKDIQVMYLHHSIHVIISIWCCAYTVMYYMKSCDLSIASSMTLSPGFHQLCKAASS